MERVAQRVAGPLGIFATVFRPLVWLTEGTAGLILRCFRVDVHEHTRPVIARDELAMLVREGGQEGILAGSHAALVARALKFDQLDARDIMVHRLDIKWLDLGLSKETLLAKLRKIPYTRLPVCRGDIDDLAGIAYLHDIVKNLSDPDFSLAKIIRPAVVVPENLPIDRVLEQMRESKTQLVIVMDEYGGTSGLVTLEDVVEEVFGELEDKLASERPAIERLGENRISARAEIRYDELLDFLGREPEIEPNTETLATLINDGLGHVPRPGDSVECPLGSLRVEHMARRRITRVGVYLTLNKE
jgi:CBS domain containing-hemolysin-like protein